MSINYLKLLNDGTQVATKHKPLFQLGERLSTGAGEQPDILIDGEWWSSVASTAEGEEFEPDTKYPVQFIYASADGHLLNVVVENGKPVSYFFNGICPTLVLDCLQVGKLETTENRVEMYLEDYGVPSLVAGANNDVVIPNPFGNENYKDCECTVEVLDVGLNDWIKINGFLYIYGVGGVGAKADAYKDGISIVPSKHYLVHTSYPNESKEPSVSSSNMKAKVTVTYKGKTKRIRA